MTDHAIFTQRTALREGASAYGCNEGKSANMIITEERLLSALDVLHHGGEEAISLFLEMSTRLHQTGHPDALRDWVTIATPALPEKERSEVMILLMREYLPPIAPPAAPDF